MALLPGVMRQHEPVRPAKVSNEQESGSRVLCSLLLLLKDLLSPLDTVSPLLHSWDALRATPVCGEATSACRTSSARAGCPGPYRFLRSCYCFLERRRPLGPVAQAAGPFTPYHPSHDKRTK